MKISPRIHITLFMLCFLLVFSACSNISSSNEKESDGPDLDAYINALDKDAQEELLNKGESESAVETEKDKGPRVHKGDISSDIRCYEIKIKDEVFCFPMSLEELESSSFTYCGETPLSDIEVEAGIKHEAIYTDGESKVIFNLLNTGNETLSADKAIVAGLYIQFDKEGSLSREEVILPHNVSCDSCDLNSLKAIYGEPSEVYHDTQVDTPKTSKLIYRTDSGLHSTTIYVNNVTQKVLEIIMLSSD